MRRPKAELGCCVTENKGKVQTLPYRKYNQVSVAKKKVVSAVRDLIAVNP
jgi:hypothetical protein